MKLCPQTPRQRMKWQSVVMELRAPQRIKESHTASSAQWGSKEGIRESFQKDLTEHGMKELPEP